MLQGIISCLHLLNHILPIKIDALVRTRLYNSLWRLGLHEAYSGKKTKKSSIDWHIIMYI
jgi:hypothetical protein